MDTAGDKMPFNKEQWAEQVRAHLLSLRNVFHKGDVPFLVYGAVAGLTLWPLVDEVLLWRLSYVRFLSCILEEQEC
ncbi:MAG: hypothetical protein V9G20_13330 [Candidatus Promineifilaceae bacterium]